MGGRSAGDTAVEVRGLQPPAATGGKTLHGIRRCCCFPLSFPRLPLHLADLSPRWPLASLTSSPHPTKTKTLLFARLSHPVDDCDYLCT
jgi:hypothetical protein